MNERRVLQVPVRIDPRIEFETHDLRCETNGVAMTTCEERGAWFSTLVTLLFLAMVVLAIHRQTSG